MSSPPKAIPVSPRALRMDGIEHGRSLEDASGSHSLGSPQHPARLSPTLTRSYDPTDPENIERQRAMDADFAMQLSRARSASIALIHRPSLSPVVDTTTQPITDTDTAADQFNALSMGEDEEDQEYFPSNAVPDTSEINNTGIETPTIHFGDGLNPSMIMSQAHDPSLLVSEINSRLQSEGPQSRIRRTSTRPSDAVSDGPPPFQASAEGNLPSPPQEHDPRSGGGIYKSVFDFSPLEIFAGEERRRMGLVPGQDRMKSVRRRLTTRNVEVGESSSPVVIPEAKDDNMADTTKTETTVEPEPGSKQQRFSQNAPPSRRQGGKLALFESTTASLPPFDLSPHPSLQLPANLPQPTPAPAPAYSELPNSPMRLLPPPVDEMEAKPYRFSFYSNALKSTIHARSLSELPAEGQSFEELFTGKKASASGSNGSPPSATPNVFSRSFTPNNNTLNGSGAATPQSSNIPINGLAGKRDLLPSNQTGNRYSDTTSWKNDEDANSWWLDVLSPTDEEMRVLSKCFGIHPLTAEDIQMEETREKIELFRNYYLVCFRSFDQNQYSPTYLEPINYYIVVFREGIISFHFRMSPHPQNVRRRIKHLKDYISVTSDWISYALIDDITDAFAPLIQSIEYEVDSIDELVLILKEAEQSDMLRRIGICRKKVMGLLRLMGNKADVVKGLAKRCNENWSMAPKSDIGLYLSDIQDHLITMTQSLNHYEKLLSRSHSNYLAQISIEMTDANNQINDVLSRLTALGTILIPMNLITGLWGMNVHVPGQDVREGYAWFIGIICFLVGIGGVGSFATYRLMRRSRKKT